MIPAYGEVRWQDAYGNDGTSKVPRKPGKMKKTLPIKASIGKLFMDADGTLAIVHEYEPKHGVYQHQVEMTMIPQAWVQEIIPLTEGAPTPKKVEGTDAIHQPVPASGT